MYHFLVKFWPTSLLLLPLLLHHSFHFLRKKINQPDAPSSQFGHHISIKTILNMLQLLKKLKTPRLVLRNNKILLWVKTFLRILPSLMRLSSLKDVLKIQIKKRFEKEEHTQAASSHVTFKCDQRYLTSNSDNELKKGTQGWSIIYIIWMVNMRTLYLKKTLSSLSWRWFFYLWYLCRGQLNTLWNRF